MKITEKDLDFLRSEIKKYVSGKRLAHTLSVEKEAAKLGSIFSLSKDKINKLAAAGILHDITKSLSTEEQIELMKKYNISLTQDDLQSPKIFHSITGAHFAREHFPEFTDREIFLSILYHTTGKPSPLTNRNNKRKDRIRIVLFFSEACACSSEDKVYCVKNQSAVARNA